MPVSPVELARIDAELDALAAGIDLARMASVVRSASRASLGEVDAALSALAADVPIAVERPERPSRAAAPRRTAKAKAKPAAPEPVIEAASTPEVEAAAAGDPAPEAVPEPGPQADAPVAEAEPANVPDELGEAAISAEALLNPFEEPVAGENEFEDENTLIIDASELGGLDMDALFDGMVEEALSSPLEEGGIVGGRAAPPVTEPPPGRGAFVEGATDIEQLRPEGEDADLDLFLEDGSIGIDDDDALEALEALDAPSLAEAEGDPDDDSPKKKGFFKKLFG